MSTRGLVELASSVSGRPEHAHVLRLHRRERASQLSPMEALQAATRNPAEFIGRLREVGTIEPGKVADIVVLDANPVVDIENTRRVAATILAGRLVTTANRQR